MRIIMIILLLTISLDAFSQKEDYIWQFGLAILDGPEDTLWGLSKLDFNFDPPHISKEENGIADYSDSHASICDDEGQLLFGSNAMQVYDRYGSVMEKGDTIAFDTVWQNKYVEVSDWKIGKREPDNIIALPMVGENNKYYLIYHTVIFDEILGVESDGYVNYFLKYAIIDFEDNELGSLVSKDSIFFENHLSTSGMMACRHANGRDWWLLKANVDHTEYFVFLIDSKGINFSHSCLLGTGMLEGLGQTVFSPDGTRLLRTSVNFFTEGGAHFQLLDFDRCNGLLSNELVDSAGDIGIVNSLTFGAAFGSNGRYFYLSTLDRLYQYDSWHPDVISTKTLIAEFDGHETAPGALSMFGSMKLAPDHKIYMAHGFGGGTAIHTISEPDKQGIECNFQAHVLNSTTYYVNTIPSIPNFRLGPIDESECDTLGIDNNPISKFRYEQSEIDYRDIQFVDLSYFRPENWMWTFGDNGTSSTQHPNHTYTQNGIYEVCLTVSNENSSNTSCNTIQLGTTGIEETEDNIEIIIYPNPVNDLLLVSLQNYIPENAKFELYNLKGKHILKTMLNFGWNTIELLNIPEGIYIYQIIENNKIIKRDKIIKTE